MESRHNVGGYGKASAFDREFSVAVDESQLESGEQFECWNADVHEDFFSAASAFGLAEELPRLCKR